ncbi:MAG: hypothetical protein ACPKPY_14200 [Nitrososphaeraceae archaeon]
MLIICIYGIIIETKQFKENNIISIGGVLANTKFPFENSFSLVTYIMIFSVISWFTAIKILDKVLKNIPIGVIKLIQILSIVALTTAIYELSYNLTLWNSFITKDILNGIINPNSINSNYPNPETPWNLLFAIQMFLASIIITGHCFYKMSNIKKPYSKEL